MARYGILPATTTSNWDSTGTWSATSGGGTGATAPDSGTAVLVDALSVAGAGAVLQINVTYADCLSMDWTGATNTPTLGSNVNTFLRPYGSATFILNMAFAFDASSAILMAGNGSLTTNGLSLSGINRTEIYASITLGDDYTGTRFAIWQTGTLNTNGKTVVLSNVIDTPGGGTPTLTLGASVVTCAGFSLTGTPTVSAGTSTIKVTGTGAFAGGGKTFCNGELNGTAHTVSGNDTFSGPRGLSFNPTGAQAITWSGTPLISVAAMSRTGGGLITWTGAQTITYTGSSPIAMYNMNLTNSTVTPLGKFYAGQNSVNTSGNTGWLWANAPRGAGGWWILNQ